MMSFSLRRQNSTGMHRERLDPLVFVIDGDMLDHAIHADLAEIVRERRHSAIPHVRRDGRDGNIRLGSVGRGGQVGDEVLRHADPSSAFS